MAFCEKLAVAVKPSLIRVEYKLTRTGEIGLVLIRRPALVLVLGVGAAITTMPVWTGARRRELGLSLSAARGRRCIFRNWSRSGRSCTGSSEPCQSADSLNDLVA
jgi:hypothetical protein